MRIGLFVTCLTDTLFPGTGQAVVAVLERLGHQVDFPAAQTCCGQMHFNTGYRREAVPMVRLPIAPAPVATTNGSRPAMKAKEVIWIGRNRNRAPSTAASFSDTGSGTCHGGLFGNFLGGFGFGGGNDQGGFGFGEVPITAADSGRTGAPGPPAASHASGSSAAMAGAHH